MPRAENSENMLRMDVQVQSLDTGLFLTRKGEWVCATERKAQALKMSAVEAIKLCLRLGIDNVKFTARSATGSQLTEYPFGLGLYQNGESSHELREKSRRVMEEGKEISDRTKALLAGAYQTLAELKERKKRVPFKRKRIAQEDQTRLSGK